MYLWYIQFYCFKNNKKELTLDDFCKQIFPLGFPSKEAMQNIWNDQKVIRTKGGSDNLVDYMKAGTSIRFN